MRSPATPTIVFPRRLLWPMTVRSPLICVSPVTLRIPPTPTLPVVFIMAGLKLAAVKVPVTLALSVVTRVLTVKF